MRAVYLWFFAGFSLVVGGAFPQISEADLSAVLGHNKLEFTVDDPSTSTGNVFSGCNDLEAAAKNLLAQLGARNIDVHCFGGMGQDGPGIQPTVTAEFDAARLAGPGQPIRADWVSVQLMDLTGCFTVQELLSNLLPRFETSDSDNPIYCASPNDGYQQRVEILMPRS